MVRLISAHDGKVTGEGRPYMERSAILSLAQSAQLFRGRVLEVNEAVVVLVDDADPLACDVLVTGGPAYLNLGTGDEVLVWRPAVPAERGIVLGKVEPPGAEAETPSELVVEARENLTLRCGDGSITLRADGKILIKGKDLVSHAQRTNRIKGGSVAIN
jgi:hypothetical protein